MRYPLLSSRLVGQDANLVENLIQVRAGVRDAAGFYDHTRRQIHLEGIRRRVVHGRRSLTTVNLAVDLNQKEVVNLVSLHLVCNIFRFACSSKNEEIYTEKN